MLSIGFGRLIILGGLCVLSEHRHLQIAKTEMWQHLQPSNKSR